MLPRCLLYHGVVVKDGRDEYRHQPELVCDLQALDQPYHCCLCPSYPAQSNLQTGERLEFLRKEPWELGTGCTDGGGPLDWFGDVGCGDHSMVFLHRGAYKLKGQ